MKFWDASAVLQLCLQEPHRRRLYGPAEANLALQFSFHRTQHLFAGGGMFNLGWCALDDSDE